MHQSPRPSQHDTVSSDWVVPFVVWDSCLGGFELRDSETDPVSRACGRGW